MVMKKLGRNFILSYPGFIPSIEVKQLPGIRFVIKLCAVIHTIGETLTAYPLSNAYKWEQMFFGVTSRCQKPLSTLVVNIPEYDDYLPLIISSSIKVRNETSEQKCSAFLDAVQREVNMASRCAEVCDKMYQ